MEVLKSFIGSNVGSSSDRVPKQDRHPNALAYFPLVLGSVLILGSGLVLFGSYWGDPTIYLIYARNIAHGDLFSFNPHQFSSGSTSPLWALLLSIPYLLGTGVAGVKVMALLATLLANWLIVRVTWEFTGVTLSGTIASLVVTEMLSLYGVLMYESSLIVALVALMIMVGRQVVQSLANNELPWKQIVILTGIWACIPVTRPDATVLVVIEVTVIWLASGHRIRSAFVLSSMALTAAIPSIVYFGYSFIKLGTFSVSSQNRAFALQESAQRIGPLHISRDALSFVFSMIYVFLLAAIGCDIIWQKRGHSAQRWFAGFALLSVPAYFLMLVFISPVTSDSARYFLPIAPVLAIAAGIALSSFEKSTTSGWRITKTLIVILLIVKPSIAIVGQAIDQKSRGYSFNEIVERDVVDSINRRASDGDRVLAYEMQDRYLLRADLDLMSLDGITDARVTPYLKSSEMGAYLLRYRPRFWIANSAVNYRPFLQRSILQRVVSRFDTDPSLSTLDTAGIRFSVLARRTTPMPRSFAGWTYLIELQYFKTPN